MIYRLPSVLTTEEFAFLVRRNVEVVRRNIRRRRIEATKDTPYRIPCRELLKFKVSLDDAAILLTERRGQAAILDTVSGVIVQYAFPSA